jgi:hypothetical protein
MGTSWELEGNTVGTQWGIDPKSKEKKNPPHELIILPL